MALKQVELYGFYIKLSLTGLISVARAVHYYANGQAIANQMIDRHFGAFLLNISIAIVITIAVSIVFVFKQHMCVLKWFSIPAVLVLFSLVHLHIDFLFPWICCPMCAGLYFP